MFITFPRILIHLSGSECLSKKLCRLRFNSTNTIHNHHCQASFTNAKQGGGITLDFRGHPQGNDTDTRAPHLPPAFIITVRTKWQEAVDINFSNNIQVHQYYYICSFITIIISFFFACCIFFTC